MLTASLLEGSRNERERDSWTQIEAKGLDTMTDPGMVTIGGDRPTTGADRIKEEDNRMTEEGRDMTIGTRITIEVDEEGLTKIPTCRRCILRIIIVQVKGLSCNSL